MQATRIIGSLALAVAGALIAPQTGAAQVDGAVLPWVGCWQEVGAPADAPMTCIVPEAGGAALLTVDRAGVSERRTLRTDGSAAAVEAGGCVGVEAAEPSSSGGRLYIHSRMECEGGAERVTRSLVAMIGPDEWIRVRALVKPGRGGVWTQRFRPARPDRVEAAGLTELEEAVSELALAIESARMAALATPTVDDVIEASARTHPELVRAWLAEQGEPLRLDRDALLRMADAGVAEEVIDVAIAVTYPERFAIGQQVERAAVDREVYDRGAYRWGGYGWWPFYYDPFYYRYRYSPYGYYGYGGWGWGGYGWGGSRVIVVQPGDDVERTPGRVINGRGYRAGSSRSSSPTRTAKPRVESGRGWTSSSRRPAASSSTKSSSSSSSSSNVKGKAKKKGGG